MKVLNNSSVKQLKKKKKTIVGHTDKDIIITVTTVPFMKPLLRARSNAAVCLKEHNFI